MTIQAVADYRGTFEQGSLTSLFLKITNFQGDAVDPSAISVEVTDSLDASVTSGTPEKIVEGFYIFDWDIDSAQDAGEYTTTWTYTVDGVETDAVQSVIVAATGDLGGGSLYSDRLSGFRASVDLHLQCAQSIPVYDEQGLICDDEQTVRFTFPRWNQNSYTRIYLNQKPVTSGITVNYFKGEIIFDRVLTEYDTVTASYNFRWFSDDQIDRFMSNALHTINLYPPSSSYNLGTLPHRFIPIIMYGASKDALRELLLCLQFQQPQEVFGGGDAAQKAFSNLETLKKNFEGDYNTLLEQKKLGPYMGLTKTTVTPEFTLPGGRSRWFRYLMGGFSL